MVTLQELNENGSDQDLMILAALIERMGLSATVPIDSCGKISLPYALAMVFGVVQFPLVGKSRWYPEAEDFQYIFQHVAGYNLRSFIYCWEALELACGEDIVEWSERVGEEAVISEILLLAKEIRYFMKSS